jgi:hypothetical protein
MKVELVPRPVEPVVTGFIDAGNDGADGGVGSRIQTGGSPAAFVSDASHARDGAVAISGAVKEVATRVLNGREAPEKRAQTD